MSESQPSGPSHTPNSDGPRSEGPLHACRGSEPTVRDESIPIPPRYWWLKRILAACGALLVFLVALRLWWGWMAERRLQAEIDRIVAAGEPLFPEDFGPFERISDDENAATLYLQAGTGFVYPAYKVVFDLAEDPMAVRERRGETASLIQANAMPLAQVREARTRERVDWHIAYASPIAWTVISTSPMQATLNALTCLAARYYHGLGTDLQAVESLHDAIAHLEALELHPFLVGHRQASEAMVRLCVAIEEIAPSLAAGSGSRHLDDHDKSLPMERVRLIISKLLDEERSQAALIRGMLQARMTDLDLVQSILNGQVTFSSHMDLFNTTPPYAILLDSSLFAPIFAQDGVVLLRASSKNVAAARNLTFPEAFADAWKPAMHPVKWSSIYDLSHPLNKEFQNFVPRSLETHFMAFAVRRMAATRLALRLFELETGRLASTLDELVPAYLAAVPRDPFAHAHDPIRYVPDASPALLYSVGLNGVDDGGKSEGKRDRAEERRFDIPFFLDDLEGRDTPREGHPKNESE